MLCMCPLACATAEVQPTLCMCPLASATAEVQPTLCMCLLAYAPAEAQPSLCVPHVLCRVHMRGTGATRRHCCRVLSRIKAQCERWRGVAAHPRHASSSCRTHPCATLRHCALQASALQRGLQLRRARSAGAGTWYTWYTWYTWRSTLLAGARAHLPHRLRICACCTRALHGAARCPHPQAPGPTAR